MLYTDPVSSDPATEHTRVFRRRPADRTTDANGVDHDFEATAFHWGGLTTGHWLTAFWILLGPFAFANVAGWMTTRNTRIAHTAIRLAGLSLTALFVVQLGYLFVEVAPALAPEPWRRATILISFPVYLILFVVGIVMWLSTQSHFHGFGWSQRLRLTMGWRRSDLLPPRYWVNTSLAGSQWDDPAGAHLDAPEMWGEHAILHRLRRIHLAGGVGVMTALMGAGTDMNWLRWIALLTAVLSMALIVLTGTNPRSRLVQSLTAWSPIIAITGWAVGYGSLFGGVPSAPWPGLHETTFAVALALGATGVAVITAGWVSLGVVVVGTLFGSSLGAGIGFIAEKLARIDYLTNNGGGWVAVAMLFLVLTLGLTATLASFGPDPTPKDRTVMTMLRRVTGRAPLLFAVAGLYGIVAGAVAFYVGCRNGCSPESLASPPPESPAHQAFLILFGALVVLVVVRTFPIKPKTAVLIGLVGGGFLWAFDAGRLPVIGFGRVGIHPNDPVELAKAFILVLPATLVLRSLIGSFRSGTSNRQVGILWDVASMWPRWFHPLAPPAYGPKVITALGDTLETSPPRLLEAHSQGSAIAVLTLDQIDQPGELALITYGSPLGHLYEPLFPETGVRDLISRVEDKVAWVNLWRDDDPVGGDPLGLSSGDVLATDGEGHSGYEVTSAFREARHRLTPSDT
jgi:hypothetical protein